MMSRFCSKVWAEVRVLIRHHEMFPFDAVHRERNQFCAELYLQCCITIYTQFFLISLPMSLTQLEF